MPRAWYVFIGSLNNSNAQFDAANYRLLSISNKPACVNGTLICTINVYHESVIAPIYPFTPFSRNIIQYIVDGLATQVSQPQIPTDSKRYVYLKNNN